MTDTDEIARLRALWCEEKSKSMTFYAEVERLRAEVATRTDERDTFAAEIDLLRARLAWRTAERDGLRSAFAGANIARAALAMRIERLESQGLTLPHDPLADRDRELRERFIESELRGAARDSHMLHEASNMGARAVYMADSALAAMRKGDGDGK
jgi:hypothetical protein